MSCSLGLEVTAPGLAHPLQGDRKQVRGAHPARAHGRVSSLCCWHRRPGSHGPCGPKVGRSLSSPGPAPPVSGACLPTLPQFWEAPRTARLVERPASPSCSNHLQLPPNPGAPWSHRSPHQAATSPSSGLQGKQPFRKVGAGGGRPGKLPTAGFRFWGGPQAGHKSCRAWGHVHLRSEHVLVGCWLTVGVLLTPLCPSPLLGTPFPTSFMPLLEALGHSSPMGTLPFLYLDSLLT